jgi:hypothetical protein
MNVKVISFEPMPAPKPEMGVPGRIIMGIIEGIATFLGAIIGAAVGGVIGMIILLPIILFLGIPVVAVYFACGFWGVIILPFLYLTRDKEK